LQFNTLRPEPLAASTPFNQAKEALLELQRERRQLRASLVPYQARRDALYAQRQQLADEIEKVELYCFFVGKAGQDVLREKQDEYNACEKQYLDAHNEYANIKNKVDIRIIDINIKVKRCKEKIEKLSRQVAREK